MCYLLKNVAKAKRKISRHISVKWFSRSYLTPQYGVEKTPSTLPSLVYIIAELTLARLGKWFVLVTSFPCKKYSSFGEEHKQRKKCSLLLLRGYSQEENWQLKLTAKVGIVNYVRSRPSLSPRQSVTYSKVSLIRPDRSRLLEFEKKIVLVV